MNQTNDDPCGWEDGEVPSRRHCSCKSCIKYCDERYGPYAPSPVAPQEWYIDRE